MVVIYHQFALNPIKMEVDSSYKNKTKNNPTEIMMDFLGPLVQKFEVSKQRIFNDASNKA